MNRKALRHYLENETGFSWEERDRGLIVKNTRLPNRLLREIGACNGVVSDHNMYGQFWVVPEGNND